MRNATPRFEMLMIEPPMPTTPPPITEWNKVAVKAAVDWMAQQAARVEHDLKINSDVWLLEHAPAALRSGLADRMKVIEAAENGDVIAHRSLMQAFHQMLDVGEMPPASLRVYAARFNLSNDQGIRQPEPQRKAGRTPYEHLHRNQGLMLLIVFTCEAFNLPPTRNREARRRRQPCGASIVEAVARRLGIEVSESRLTNLWAGHGVRAVQQFRAHVRKRLLLAET